MNCKFCDVELEKVIYEPLQRFQAGARVIKHTIAWYCPKCGLMYKKIEG